MTTETATLKEKKISKPKEKAPTHPDNFKLPLAKDVMADAIKMIKEYDEATESMKAGEIDDALIDKLIGGQNDIAKVLDAMIMLKKIEGARRLAATKKEEAAMKIIKRGLDRLGLNEWAGSDGVATGTVRRTVECVDESQVPNEYKGWNRQKVQSALAQGVSTIPGIAVTFQYLEIKVK